MDDPKFGYRIYRFDKPLAPGATSALTFKSRLWQRGFHAFNPADRHHRERHVREQFRLRAVIGMSRDDLLRTAPSAGASTFPPSFERPSSRTCRRPRSNYIGSDWVTADITLTTDAGQTPIAPGDRVSDTTATAAARRTSSATRRSSTSSRSSRRDYKVATAEHNGIKLSVYLQRRARLERAEDAERDGDRARLLPGALRPLPVRLCADHRVPGLRQLRPGLRRDHALFGIDRLQRQHQRSRPRSTGRPTSSRTRCRTNIGRTR